jgi:integrase
MTKTVIKFTALQIARITKPGRHPVDAGLYFQFQSMTARSWFHRYQFRGKERWSGLGPYPEVTLAEARAKRDEERVQIRKGIDPVAARQAERAEAAIKQVKTKTFTECGDACLADRAVGWRHPTSAKNWRGSLANWVYPIIGDLSVQEVDKTAVMRVLEQELDGTKLWFARAKTAEQVRNGIEIILDWARAREYRSGENPARWRGNINQLLPVTSKIYKSEHRAALPYCELPKFMKVLRARKQNTGQWAGGSVSLRALELAILTAARSKEATEARWEEINFTTKIWTVPAERMKAEREHRVPLSPAAIALLDEMLAARTSQFRKRWQRGYDHSGEFIFPGIRRRGGVSGRMLLNLLSAVGYDGLTVHGFRSTFRDWVADRTDFPGELAEIALAHTVANQTEAAYRRGDQLEKRRKLMNAWADHCEGKLMPTTADVIPMRPGA